MGDMTEYIIMELATKTEELSRKVDNLQDILSRIAETGEQLAELTEDIRNRVTDR